MKSWQKPTVVSDQVSLEVTRYLPAELGNCERPNSAKP